MAVLSSLLLSLNVIVSQPTLGGFCYGDKLSENHAKYCKDRAVTDLGDGTEKKRVTHLTDIIDLAPFLVVLHPLSIIDVQ